MNTTLHRVCDSEPIDHPGDSLGFARALAALITVLSLVAAACVHWVVPALERASR